jgi:hypothetical protein
MPRAPDRRPPGMVLRRRTPAELRRRSLHPAWFFVLLWLGVAVVTVTAYLLDSTY